MDTKTIFAIVGWVLFDIFFAMALAMYLKFRKTFLIRKRLPLIVIVTSIMIGASTNFDYYQLMIGLSSTTPVNTTFTKLIVLIFKITQSSAVLFLILRSIHLNMKYYSYHQSAPGFIDLKNYERLRNARIYIMLGVLYIIFLFAFFITSFIFISESSFENLQNYYFLVQRSILTIFMILVMLASLSIQDKLGIKVELFGLSIIWTLFIVVFVLLKLLENISSIKGTVSKYYNTIYRLFKIFLSNVATLCIILVYPVWISVYKQRNQKKKQLGLTRHRNSSLEDFIGMVNRILEHKEKLPLFKLAAQKLFSLELVLFCLEVNKYTKNEKRTKTDAMKIYSKFIKDGAPDQVNIKYSTKKGIEEQLGLPSYYGTIIKRKRKLPIKVKINDKNMSELKNENETMKIIFKDSFNECVKLLADNVLRAYLEELDV
eukprot:GAHX01001617.1.p1 GENE.GAHX01001617.1~~GAHX01001617.1.p1  ORF type:complete len:430 (+),score=68.51 GAHX01001617.1:56-1345(+)